MISVIVCTRNNSTKLQKALNSLAGLNIPPDFQWELIIVDNGSNDDTPKIIDNFKMESRLSVEYIFEPRRGQSNARNRGISEARGEVIAFTDDDCTAHPDWLQKIGDEFAADPSLLILGGRILLYNQQDLPITIITTENKCTFRSPSQLFDFLFGCNMSFRKNVINVLGDFDPYFGPGSRYFACDDIDFIYRAYKKKLKIVYSPDVVIFHDHGRRTPQQFENLKYQYNFSRGALYCKHILKGDLQMLFLMLNEIAILFFNFFKRSGNSSPAKKTNFIRAFSKGFFTRLYDVIRHSSKKSAIG